MLCKDCFMRVADCNACAEPKITIPKNATNGDMFVAVFKPYKVVVYSAQVQVYLTEQKWQMFGIDWWNSPYKADKESE